MYFDSSTMQFLCSVWGYMWLCRSIHFVCLSPHLLIHFSPFRGWLLSCWIFLIMKQPKDSPGHRRTSTTLFIWIKEKAYFNIKQCVLLKIAWIYILKMVRKRQERIFSSTKIVCIEVLYFFQYVFMLLENFVRTKCHKPSNCS